MIYGLIGDSYFTLHHKVDTTTSSFQCLSILGSLSQIFHIMNFFEKFSLTRHSLRSAGIIIAGHDPLHGGSVYSIPLGGSLHKQPYAIGGSGSTYIYGYCDSYWKEGMSEAEGIDFVKGALREAIKWDGSSGGVIRLVVLTAKGAVRHLYLPDQDYAGPGKG